MRKASIILTVSITALVVFISGCDMDVARNDTGARIPAKPGESVDEGGQGATEYVKDSRLNLVPVKAYKNTGMGTPVEYYYYSAQTMHETWSDGTRITDSISSIHVPENREAIIYRYADYKGDYRLLTENSSPSHFWNLKNITMSGDMNWDNRVSSMEVRKKITIPSKLDYIKSEPKDSEFGGDVNVNEVQGIANNGSYWYICNRTRIYRCNQNDITYVHGSTSAGSLPSAIDDYNHFGDLAYYDGRLYVPHYKKDSSKASVVVVYDYLLRYQTYAYFPTNIQAKAAWVAINPVNGLIYSTDDYKVLKVYDSSIPYAGATLTYLFSVSLDFGSLGHSDGSWWNGVWNQGGEFGPDGLFYYVLDHKSDEDSAYTGFYIFKITGRKGTAKWRANIKYDPDYGDGWKRDSELEGITYFDRGSASKYPGQVHVLYLHNEADEDDCWLMHYATK